jgi:branched-chain amino acid transport system substrate-binding protein
MAILNENTDFGVSAAKSAKQLAEGKGLKVVFEEAYSAGSPDYRSTLTKVKATSPDLVFMVSYVADAILLMRQSREIGLSPMAFLGAGAGFSTTAFAAEKEISHTIFSSTQWTGDVSWPGARAFADRYQKQFGKVPTYHAANAYAALVAMVEAAVKAGGDRAKTAQVLRTTTWDGLFGPVKFQDYDGYQGQNKHQMLVEQVQNGKYVTVYPTSFATGKAIFPFPGWTK